MPSSNGIDFTIEGARQFKDLAAKLRGPVSRELRLQLNKQIRAAAKPMVEDVRAAVLAIPTKSGNTQVSYTTKAGTTRMASRSQVNAWTRTETYSTSTGSSRAGASSGETARALHAGSRGGARMSHGLRETIARSIQVKITQAGSRAGVRIRVDGTKLPADQRALPRALDKAAGWRHPVFGHDVWVHQTGAPWFMSILAARAPDVRHAISDAMHTVAAKL